MNLLVEENLHYPSVHSSPPLLLCAKVLDLSQPSSQMKQEITKNQPKYI